MKVAASSPAGGALVAPASNGSSAIVTFTNADVVTLGPPPVKVAGTVCDPSSDGVPPSVDGRSENASEAPVAWSTIVTSTRRQTNTTRR